MQKKLSRLLIMLTALPSFPGRLSTGKLRQQLLAAGHDIGLRTVQRNLIDLSITYPIANDGAKPAGWYWDKNAKPLGLSALDPHTALVMQLARIHLERLLPNTTLDHLAPQFRMARESLDLYGNGLRKWPDKIRVLPKGPAQALPAIHAEVQATIYDALLQEKQARIHYKKNLAQKAKAYEINPLGLIVRDRLSYLIATLAGTEEIRQFALHRMQSAELLETQAKCPSDFDLDSYIRQGEMGYPSGATLNLEAAFTPASAVQVRECPLSDDQEVRDGETEEDDVIITATVSDNMELRWWLLSFGDDVEVLGPPALRAWFGEVAERISQYYRDPPFM